MKKVNRIFPILAGSILRILWVVYRGIPFNSDSAVFGLMAKHIFLGKERPFFFYGQSYLSAATSYILAFIMKFTNDPMTPFFIYGTVCSIILYVLVVFFVKDVLGNQTAWWVSLLMIAPPYYLVIWLTGVYGYYIYIFIGIIYLWSLARWVKNDFKVTIKWLIINGFIAGIGWYSHPMFFYFLALFALLWMIYFFKSGRMFIVFFEKLLLWLFCFFAGSFFYWLGFIKHFYEINPIRSFKLDIMVFVKGFLYALWKKIPTLLSLDKGFLPLRIIILGFYIAIFVFVIYSIYKIVIERKLVVKDIFILLGAIIVLIYSFEQPYYLMGNVRHLIFLLVILPVLITFFIEKYCKGKLILKYFLVFIIFIHNVSSAFCYINQEGNIPKFMSYLRNKNLTKGFADYWISYYVDYMSGEEIIIALLYDVDRYGEYSANIIAADNKFYLFDLNDEKQNIKYEKFANCLKKSELIYDEDIVGNYRVFHSLYDKNGSRINYITPLFEEYFNKDDKKKHKLWNNAFFLRDMPAGSYRLKIGVSGEYTDELSLNKKVVTLVGNKIEDSKPFVMIQFKNGDFKNRNFIEKSVSFYYPVEARLCFATRYLQKLSSVDYIILQDYKPDK